MSGTSVDGIDLALIEDEPLTLLASDYVPFKKHLKSRLLAVIQNKPITAMEMARLDADLGQSYRDAVTLFIDKYQVNDIKAIGLHGQTVAHLPQCSPTNSWQIGHPSWVAVKTGIPVISDFRRTDMAYDGQGAPLAPALHEALFKRPNKTIGVLNLGGIANLTLINQTLIGFDVGPANCLLDEWCYAHTGQPYDNNGEWAQTGTVNRPLLETLLQDTYFKQQPPKSTGREYFNQHWLMHYLESIKISPVDVQRTLVDLVAATVNQAVINSQQILDQLIVVGGGVYNQLLMASLEKTIACQVVSSEHYDISPDDIEAMLMAWLAARHYRGQKTDLQSVTGCRKAHIYGICYPL
jgi:anhydro-N-acetylmuramic acid kinase